MIKWIIYLLRIFKSFESPIILKWAQQYSAYRQKWLEWFALIYFLYENNAIFTWISNNFYMNFTQIFNRKKHVKNNSHESCTTIMRISCEHTCMIIAWETFHMNFNVSLHMKSHDFIWKGNRMKKSCEPLCHVNPKWTLRKETNWTLLIYK